MRAVDLLGDRVDGDGRGRELGLGGEDRERVAPRRELLVAARQGDGEGRDQGRRDDILGRGRDNASERVQGRDRDRDREL